MRDGNLRSKLTLNGCNKYTRLFSIAKSLPVHGDFHGGNILLDVHDVLICDFGLRKPANQPNQTNEIYGVLPYIAPEILRGKKYTKAADVYSFGIIMWELISGIPAFNKRPHDFKLALKICKGERPDLAEGIAPEYQELMKRCWDSDPNKRPSAIELMKYFGEWQVKYEDSDDDRIPVSS